MRRVLLFVCITLLPAVILLTAGQARAGALQARGDHNLPPYEFIDADGEPAGFNIDVLRAVAATVDLDIEIRLQPWSQVRQQLENAEIDIATGMIASAERENRVDFSNPILTVDYAAFTRPDSPVNTLKDLRDRALIVQRNDIMHDYVRDTTLSHNIVAVETQIEALRLLASGRHDAALTSKLQGLYLIHKFKLSNVEIVQPFFHAQDLCFAVAEDNDRLQAQLNEGLRRIRADGRYDAIYQRWFGSYEQRDASEAILAFIIWGILPLATLLLAASGWNWSLKRQVRIKTEELRQELIARQREKVHLASERHYRDFVEAAPMPMAVADRRQRILYLNDKFIELFGYNRNDLPTAAAWWQLAYPDEQLQAEARSEFRHEIIPKLRRGREAVSRAREVTCKDGSARFVMTYFSPVGNRTFIVCNDITDMKGAELALRRSEARLMGIYHNLGAGIEVLDRNGIIIEVNNRLAEMLGYPAEELVGKSPLFFTHPDDLEASRTFLAQALQGKLGTYRREKRYQRKDGSFFWADLSFTQVVGPGGEILADIGIIFDITERKAVEQQLREVNRELEAFVYSVSHDLRSPLTPILGYTEYLATTCRDRLDAQALDCLQEIEKAGTRMQNLIEDLLQLAKVGHLDRPDLPVDVDRLVDEVIQDHAPRIADGDIRIERQPLPSCRIPPTLLRQLFDNLLGNALRYGARPGETIELAGENTDGRVRYRVIDHGCGIPPEERKQVFDLFYRGASSSDQQGTGIGLAIVRKIARLYDGEAWAEETPGGGTTFVIDMPTSQSLAG